MNDCERDQLFAKQAVRTALIAHPGAVASLQPIHTAFASEML
jgi:hypothetical protein